MAAHPGSMMRRTTFLFDASGGRKVNLLTKKFNQIDLATASVGGFFFGHEEYLAWLISLLAGAAISVIAGQCCDA